MAICRCSYPCLILLPLEKACKEHGRHGVLRVVHGSGFEYLFSALGMRDKIWRNEEDLFCNGRIEANDKVISTQKKTENKCSSVYLPRLFSIIALLLTLDDWTR